jgi:L-ascorbate metabolism protein UlaG (beta-lactamase superfamily)
MAHIRTLFVSFVLVLGCASPEPVDMSQWASLVAEPAEADFVGVTVTFMGVTTLVIRDEETTLMIDGFFTRPDLGGLGMLGKVAPDRELIRAGLALAQVESAAAITTVHSHFDHAMDTGLVAQETGAMVLGSSSTANIARGAGLPEERIREVAPGDTAQFGAFTMKWFASKHYPLPPPFHIVLGTQVEEPLVPPARVTAWGEGRSDTIVIEHPRGTVVVQGSAGFVAGSLSGVDADVVLLGIGGLGGMEAPYQEDYWRETVTAVSPARVYATHWDDFNRPLSEPLAPSGIAGDDFEPAMAFLQAKSSTSGIHFGLLPFAVPVALY